MSITTTDTHFEQGFAWGECQYTFKLVLQGLSGAGKSQLYNRFINDQFSKAYQATYRHRFGVRFLRHMDKKVQVQLWDSAGSDNFVVVNPVEREADAHLLVFDITDRASFRKVRSLYTENKHFSAGKNKQPLTVIIGAKADLAY